jgi:hypothetical protein
MCLIDGIRDKTDSMIIAQDSANLALGFLVAKKMNFMVTIGIIIPKISVTGSSVDCVLHASVTPI